MVKNLILFGIVAFVLMTVFNQIGTNQQSKEISYSEFIEEVKGGQVDSVVIEQDRVTGKKTTGEEFEAVLPQALDIDFLPILRENNIKISAAEPESPNILLSIFIQLIPMLLILGLIIFFMRQMQGGGGRGNPMSFGKSKAKLIPEDQIKTTFADVAGCDEAKEEVGEIVEFLKDPDKFGRLGGRVPKGILMVGPPGTGKTLLAKAIAGEAKVPFFTISGSDFVEMFVGVGASRVRDMFEQARKSSPCIIFIDEIDAVGRARGNGNFSGGHDEREQTLNQMLVEMDGMGSSEGVIIIAATNRPDVLDKALLRPGRFDRQVNVSLPDIKGREQILNVHMKKVPLDKDVDPLVIARGTPGFSGADLANLVNEAALFAARQDKRLVDMRNFEDARDKIMMGAERRSMVMSEKEKEATAYHESGHAILGWLMPEHDPVHKVTIIPRGRALGVTHYLPEDDKHSHSLRYLKGRLVSAYGGRVAEEMMYGNEGISTGAQGDIQYATQMARAMVTRWGYSDKLGPLLYQEDENGFGVSQAFSPDTAKIIDDEAKTLIENAYDQARDLLKTHEDKLHAMKDALMKYETIDAQQVADIMNGSPVRPPKDWDNSGSSGSQDPDADIPVEAASDQSPEAGDSKDDSVPKTDPI
ncbi:MAG: ATP-dependent zinc metalloprotease FtsH [Pseudomonadota bacterium]|nr:ATP-dependent zinc metalloprotease FtsH [Pseudomonadota bacterium]